MKGEVPVPEITLKRAGSGDAEMVRSLTRAAYAKWVPVIGREPLPMTANYEQAVQEHLIDLLYSSNHLAGLIETIPCAVHLLIENVAVSPDSQGYGYGRMLMEHAENLARSLGLGTLKLYTNKMFAENIMFYQQLDYLIDREEPFRGGSTVYMSKHLPAV